MLEARDGRRVVVTGVGVVAPCGTGAAAFWEGLCRPPADEVVRSVPDFDPAAWDIRHQEARRLDRFAQLALAAATQALADAGVPDGSPAALGDPERCGTVVATGIGGARTWERQVHTLVDAGERKVSPFTVPMVMPNAAAAAVSMRWGFRGPCETVATACASGTHAVAHGARLVASGRCDAVLVGGAESCATDTNVAAFTNMRALSASGISRPFDVARDGFCTAEAAGMLLLEEASAARARGARSYAEVAGAASNADAHHITAPAPEGRGAAACMRLAIADAGLAPADVTHVNAHGTSTPLNDAAEATAIRAVFGPHRPLVTSVKGVTGHSLGAAGAVEAVALALSYAHRALPPTMGTSHVDPALDLDVVLADATAHGGALPWEPAPALSNSFAFGGHNGCLLFVPT